MRMIDVMALVVQNNGWTLLLIYTSIDNDDRDDVSKGQKLSILVISSCPVACSSLRRFFSQLTRAEQWPRLDR